MKTALLMIDSGEVVSADDRRISGVSRERFAMLAEAGLLELAPEGYRRAGDVPAGLITLFAPLLCDFEITLKPVSLVGCPIFFCTGIVRISRSDTLKGAVERVALPAGGQGTSAARAVIGCIGELAERISLFRAAKEDPRVRVLPRDATDLPLGPLIGFSRQQEHRFESGQSGEPASGQEIGFDWNGLSPERVRVERLPDCTEAYLPALGVLMGTSTPSAHSARGVVSSSGMAVWADREGAVQRALLEMAERDAMAQAWYNRLGITRIESHFMHSFFSESFVCFLTGRERRTGFYRIDTDLPVHVVAAISHYGNGHGAAFGVSSGYDAATACESAAFEMLQNEISLDLMERVYPAAGEAADKNGGSRPLPSALRYAREVSIVDDLGLDAVQTASGDALSATFAPAALENALAARGFDIWMFDATRPDLNIPCVKLLSADLCGWEPRFGKARLFHGVIERGLAADPATEKDFAARPFPF